MSEGRLPRVRYRDGIEIERADGWLVADADTPPATGLLSHAHGDHLFSEPPNQLICSELTAALAARRTDTDVTAAHHPAVDLRPAGHIAGSRAALIEADGGTVLYTGDVSTRDRFYLDGFEPPSADVLVVESTYGTPEYVFPPQWAVEQDIVDWLDDVDGPVVLFGYALGRAQKLQLLVKRSRRNRLFVSDAIAALNEPIAAATGVTFGAERWDHDRALADEDALVLPTQLNGFAWVESLIESAGAATAGVSGWAVDESFRYQGGYDATFPLSDHCDFEELCRLVEAVDPEQVYTHHGFADAFARHLTAKGYDATALRANQTSLSEF
ncbi:mRNA 3'-end processing factor [Halosegnis sp.]|uniref:mRNA 3'-end processing factor n=1 Tax=Halosegnis sp. TaxID=2864959 RepID=UPI0035D42366